MRLADKVVIVTGAGSGFGEGIASRLAQEGAKVLVNDINADAGERVADAIRKANGNAQFEQADVTRDADWVRLVRSAESKFGRLDVVINNAG
ncbi:MAG: SDR family NAD(P)-dependent oxidoreductase, partial [Burkholderiales bacterium]